MSEWINQGPSRFFTSEPLAGKTPHMPVEILFSRWNLGPLWFRLFWFVRIGKENMVSVNS